MLPLKMFLAIWLIMFSSLRAQEEEDEETTKRTTTTLPPVTCPLGGAGCDYHHEYDTICGSFLKPGCWLGCVLRGWMNGMCDEKNRCICFPKAWKAGMKFG